MTNSTGPYVAIEVMLKHTSERAILVCDQGDGSSEGVWLPKSQVSGWEEVGNICTVTMPEWLAIERGLV